MAFTFPQKVKNVLRQESMCYCISILGEKLLEDSQCFKIAKELPDFTSDLCFSPHCAVPSSFLPTAIPDSITIELKAMQTGTLSELPAPCRIIFQQVAMQLRMSWSRLPRKQANDMSILCSTAKASCQWDSQDHHHVDSADNIHGTSVTICPAILTL